MDVGADGAPAKHNRSRYTQTRGLSPGTVPLSASARRISRTSVLGSYSFAGRSMEYSIDVMSEMELPTDGGVVKVMVVEPTEEAEFEGLMNASSYRDFVAEREAD